MPSPTGWKGKLISPWCSEAKVLIDNHRTALRVYIAIRLRDKGWPKALISVVTLTSQYPTAVGKQHDRTHFCIGHLTLQVLMKYILMRLDWSSGKLTRMH